MAGYLIVTVIPHFLGAGWQANLKIAAAIAGLIIFYTVMHLVIAKYVPHLNRWLGALLAIIPAALLFLLGGGIGQMGSLSYIGGSLFIDSLNGDSGCEVKTSPGGARYPTVHHDRRLTPTHNGIQSGPERINPARLQA